MRTATHSEREKFVALIQQHAGGEPATRYSFAQRLMRFGATYGRIQENQCNGYTKPGTYDWDEEANQRDERKAEKIETTVTALCLEYECKPLFSGDPRGNTLKIEVSSGYSNSFGGEGICVPTS